MNHPTRPAGFTLIELLVVIAIVAVLAGLLFVAIGNVVQASRTTACMSNLRQISIGLQTYRTTFGNFAPPGNLPHALEQIVSDPEIFICPNDHDPEFNDSYSEFYIPRTDTEASYAIISCPRHGGGDQAGTLYGNAGVQTGTLTEAEHNGSTVQVGDVVTGGQLSFEDGSQANLSDGLQVQVLTTLRESDGTLYTILRVLPNQSGTVDAEVTPGSKFEVVTPAVIAGVQGTRFTIGYGRTLTTYTARIRVTKGSVYLHTVGTPHAGKRLKAEHRKAYWSLPPEMQPRRALIERLRHRYWKEAHYLTRESTDKNTYPYDSSLENTVDQGWDAGTSY